MSLKRQIQNTPTTATTTQSTSAPVAKRPTQLSLANFFSGVKKVKPKVDTPDDIISRYIIPNELFSGVKRMRGFYNSKRASATEPKTAYWEMKDMNDCVTVLDEVMSQTEAASSQSPIEGMLIDPPWDFYVADGRNDGRCTWSLTNMVR
jgi:hypothetical protein